MLSGQARRYLCEILNPTAKATLCGSCSPDRGDQHDARTSMVQHRTFAVVVLSTWHHIPLPICAKVVVVGHNCCSLLLKLIGMLEACIAAVWPNSLFCMRHYINWQIQNNIMDTPCLKPEVSETNYTGKQDNIRFDSEIDFHFSF